MAKVSVFIARHIGISFLLVGPVFTYRSCGVDYAALESNEVTDMYKCCLCRIPFSKAEQCALPEQLKAKTHTLIPVPLPGASCHSHCTASELLTANALAAAAGVPEFWVGYYKNSNASANACPPSMINCKNSVNDKWNTVPTLQILLAGSQVDAANQLKDPGTFLIQKNRSNKLDAGGSGQVFFLKSESYKPPVAPAVRTRVLRLAPFDFNSVQSRNKDLLIKESYQVKQQKMDSMDIVKEAVRQKISHHKIKEWTGDLPDVAEVPDVFLVRGSDDGALIGMERMASTLSHLIHEGDKLGADVQMGFAKNMACAILALHSRIPHLYGPIYHGDIKPANFVTDYVKPEQPKEQLLEASEKKLRDLTDVVTDKNSPQPSTSPPEKLMLIDFGLSLVHRFGELDPAVGVYFSAAYAAPQLLAVRFGQPLPDDVDVWQNDVWGVCTSIGEMIWKTEPWKGLVARDLRQKALEYIASPNEVPFWPFENAAEDVSNEQVVLAPSKRQPSDVAEMQGLAGIALLERVVHNCLDPAKVPTAQTLTCWLMGEKSDCTIGA